MASLSRLSSLALRPLLGGACEALGVKIAYQAGDAVVGFLARHFTDHSQRLNQALANSHERAWKVLEIALAGDSWWDRCKGMLAPGEQKALRQQVQAFLDSAPLEGLTDTGPEFRQKCLHEMREARKAGFLGGAALDPRKLAQETAAFASFSDPQKLLDAEWQTLEQLAGEAKEARFHTLAQFLALRPPQGPPLLVLAIRYFFRREVETDRELFQGLAWAKMENLAESQERGFAGLSEALAQHGQRLEELLGDVRGIVTETHEEVLDIKAELQRLGPQVQELGRAVLQALEQRQLGNRELHPGDSLSIRGENERQLVKQVLDRFRALPADRQEQSPALLNGIGKLQHAAGNFEEAQEIFQEVAQSAVDPFAQAEAHYNAYQSALERREWAEALTAIQEAASLDPERFAPFPLGKFEPQRILGAGGFGVVFLCKNRHSGSRVVIKSLRLEGLERDVADIFREAQVLEDLDHPTIIRLRDSDYADEGKTRPFLLMDYFEGETLQEYVEGRGPLATADFVSLARLVAEGLQTAHARGILHRDVKPANLLVRKDAKGWQIKLIDFGLALRQVAEKSTAKNSAAHSKTLIGSSIAGTLEYAAPEQMGKLPGVAVGPYSDVFGFGRTCCYALFKTAQPTFQHWKKVPQGLGELLGHCLAEPPKERPADFAVVLRRLESLGLSPAAKTSANQGEEICDVLPVRPAPARPPARPPEAPDSRRESPRSRPEPRPRPEPPPRSRRRVWPWVLVLFAGMFLLVLGMAMSGFMPSFRWPSSSRPNPFGQNPFGQNPDGGAGRPKEDKATATPKELDKAIADLQGGDVFAQGPAAELLARVESREPTEFMLVFAGSAQAGFPSTVSWPGLFVSGQETLPVVYSKRRQQIARALETALKSSALSPKGSILKALAVWGIPENVPAVMGAVDDPFEWEQAMKTLVALQDERGAEAIAKHLENDVKWGKHTVSQYLKNFGPKAEKAVLKRLKDPNAAVRAEACNILQAIGTKNCHVALAKATRDADAKVAGAAKLALTSLGADDLIPPTPAGKGNELAATDENLKKALKDIQSSDIFTRNPALDRLAKMDRKAELPEFMALFSAAPSAGFPNTMPWAVLSLHNGFLEGLPPYLPSTLPEEIARQLERMLNETGGFSPREGAAKALGAWGTKESVRPLLQLLAERDHRSQNAAMEALGKLKAAEAAEPIAERLAEFFTGKVARQALLNIGPAAEKGVAKGLKHNTPKVRLEASKMLKEIGTRDSIAALEEAAKDPDKAVAAAARDALEKIKLSP